MLQVYLARLIDPKILKRQEVDNKAHKINICSIKSFLYCNVQCDFHITEILEYWISWLIACLTDWLIDRIYCDICRLQFGSAEESSGADHATENQGELGCIPAWENHQEQRRVCLHQGDVSEGLDDQHVGNWPSHCKSLLSVALLLIHICPSISLSVCLSVCLSVYLSICLSVCLSIYLHIYLCVCLSVCQTIYLLIYLFYLFIYLSMCDGPCPITNMVTNWHPFSLTFSPPPPPPPPLSPSRLHPFNIPIYE